jgi:predicted TIM-barrel fold metal-dependent hydrolase
MIHTAGTNSSTVRRVADTHPPVSVEPAGNDGVVARPAFIDTHVHFHDFSHPTLRWDWLLPDAVDPDLGDYGAVKTRRYLPEDFIGETRFHAPERVVHVQAAVGSPDPVDETRWLQDHADRVGLPHGIVAYADLADLNAADVLARHAEFPNLRGLRDQRYDDYLTHDTWLRGFRQLERYELVYCDDPLVEHMPLLAALARQHPTQLICVDHAGYPRERNTEYFARWRSGMEELSACENTVVKISGLGMGDHRWTAHSLRPWVISCIELWGTDRAFFGTNWPVDRLFSSYRDVLCAYEELTSSFTPDEQRNLLSENARRVFRL